MNRFDLRVRYGAFELAAAMEWDAPCAALFGASGAGKTTVLEALAGARPEVFGSFELNGRRLDGLPAREREVGWVPQDAALLPHLTAAENLSFAIESRGGAEGRRWANEAVEALEIGDLLERGVSELSGGERQRVALARALASRPRLLLLDEPLASIDRPLRSRVVPFLRGLYEEHGIPILLVTHDPLEVAALAGHVALIEGGRVVEEGEPRAVFVSAAAFGALWALGAENRFDVTVAERGPGTLKVETAGGLALSMVAVEGFPDPSSVAVRAEDVLLAAERPRRVSAQNVIEGRVAELEPAGRQVVVHIDAAGERWKASVTVNAVRELELAEGVVVHLLIKAHAIQPSG